MKRDEVLLAKELNQRLLDTYAEFKERGISMQVYMTLIASHAAALASFQDEPGIRAAEFANQVFAGVDAALEDRRRRHGL